MILTVPLRFTGNALAHMLSDALLAASQTVVAGTLYNVYLGLFTAWPGFALGLQMSQLTEPIFGGYARKIIAWGDTGVDKSARPEVLGSNLQFAPTDLTASSSVIGVFIADALTNGNLLAAGLLPGAVVMATPTDVLGVIPRFALPGNETLNWGEFAAIY